MGSRLSLVLCVSTIALTVAGCEDTLSTGSSRADTGATASAERPAATKLVEQDVEAPEIFQETEAGLWDGRPSLGGVWVAHPNVKDPERVIIRNEANGQFVIGALFRRERENPGPRFQVSSDAAASLGMLAGSPTRLNVTALRREEQKAPAPAEVAPEGEPVAEATDTNAEPVEAEEIAAAAPAAANPQEPAEAAEAASGEEGVADAEAEEAPRQRWNPFRRRAAEPKTAVAAAGVATAAAGTVVDTPPAEERAEATAADSAARSDAVISVETVSAEALDSDTLDTDTSDGEEALGAVTAGAAVAAATPETPRQRWNPFRRRSAEPMSALSTPGIDGAEAGTIVDAPALADPEAGAATSRALRTPEIESTALAPTPTAARAPARAAAGDGYVQIGIFSQEGNAERAAQTMRSNGVIPTVYKQESQGKTFWRVVVGPAKSAAERSEVLATVRDLGFPDAYAVTR